MHSVPDATTRVEELLRTRSVPLSRPELTSLLDLGDDEVGNALQRLAGERKVYHDGPAERALWMWMPESTRRRLRYEW
ncbi:MAG: hypothetical protein KY455_03720 [Euryarchaeota archaeon]|nr:hypothetical protein [Euryarchaeota archaeon]